MCSFTVFVHGHRTILNSAAAEAGLFQRGERGTPVVLLSLLSVLTLLRVVGTSACAFGERKRWVPRNPGVACHTCRER